MVRITFPFSWPFPQLDFSMHSGRPLAHFWRPWASKWLTFGSPWLPLVHFWYLLFPFWFPLAHFWYPFRGDYEIFIQFHTFLWIFTIGQQCLRFFMFFATPLLKVCIFANILSRPGPERNLAVGNLDPLWARRRPGRVSIVPRFLYLLVFLLSVYLLSLTL